MSDIFPYAMWPHNGGVRKSERPGDVQPRGTSPRRIKGADGAAAFDPAEAAYRVRSARAKGEENKASALKRIREYTPPDSVSFFMPTSMDPNNPTLGKKDEPLEGSGLEHLFGAKGQHPILGTEEEYLARFRKLDRADEGVKRRDFKAALATHTKEAEPIVPPDKLKEHGLHNSFGKAIDVSNPFPYALWPHNGGLRKAAGNPVNPGMQVTGASAGPSLKGAEIGHFNALATHGGHAQKVMGLSQRGVSASDPDHQIATSTMMETRPAAQKALQGLQGTTLGTHLANFHQARTQLQGLQQSGGDPGRISAAREIAIGHANAAGNHVFGESGWKQITGGDGSRALSHMNAVAHPALFHKA